MKIAIDMVGTKIGSGTRTYNTNFCNYLNKINFKDDIYVFVSNDYIKEIINYKNDQIKYILLPNFLSITILRLFWMQFILPFHLKILKIDCLFAPMNFAPIFLKIFNIKLILALHSNLPWVLFTMMPGNILRNVFTKIIMELSIRSCDKLIVDSNFSKDEIVDLLKIDQKKVNVIYLGVDKKYTDNSKNEDYIKDFVYENYMLSVLSCVKYHNIINLLKAFKLFKKENKTKLRFLLVLQILDKNYYFEIKEYIKSNFFEKEVIIFNSLDNKYLINLYRKAKFYIFSSYSEVFGFTSLEAMSQNCPVIISKRSSLPEINSNAALYFNPDDEVEIKNQMKKIFFEKKLSSELVTKGNDHFKKFTWENTVKKTLEVILH